VEVRALMKRDFVEKEHARFSFGEFQRIVVFRGESIGFRDVYGAAFSGVWQSEVIWRLRDNPWVIGSRKKFFNPRDFLYSNENITEFFYLPWFPKLLFAYVFWAPKITFASENSFQGRDQQSTLLYNIPKNLSSKLSRFDCQTDHSGYCTIDNLTC